MSHEIFVQYSEEGEPERFLTHDQIAGLPRVKLCQLYTQDQYIDMMRVGNNNFQTAKFAGNLIRELGFTIPHPEFYPDEYAKFEKDWAEFTKHAKDHLRIMELQDRQALLLQERIDHLMGSEEPFNLKGWSILLDGNIEDLRKLGVYK